jgi:hypothetical protein
MSIYAVLTPTTACRALREAGFPHPAEALHIDAREERWAVSLPDGHIAWFPASEAGATRLAVERRVLGLLASRCSFRVPEILFVSNSGFDVRRMVPGRCDPWGLYRRCQADRRLAQKIGRAIGQILVEQHTRIVEADAAGWVRQQVPWPETGAWIGERLPSVIDDRGLIRALADVIEEYEGMAVDAADRALVHGDLGLHNLPLDQADAVNGVFDYDGAAWADRHHDFRYLLFDVGCEDMLDAALRIYEPAVERRLDRNRIRLYNAACAIGYLAFRAGVPPEQKSCGRTLVEDLQWARTALAKLTS